MEKLLILSNANKARNRYLESVVWIERTMIILLSQRDVVVRMWSALYADADADADADAYYTMIIVQ